MASRERVANGDVISFCGAAIGAVLPPEGKLNVHYNEHFRLHSTIYLWSEL